MENNNLQWDPEIDTPATIVVVGGGPVGIEAALYGRFLGYSVVVLDTLKVGHSLLRWGDTFLPAPWGEVTSPLGLAALNAQGVSDLPAADQRVTFRQFVEKYLLPVARTDLLYDYVEINSEVISISRLGCCVGDSVSLERQSQQEFRVLINSKKRGEYSQVADIILDCSGASTHRIGIASGGGMAVGEATCRSAFSTGKIDLSKNGQSRYSGKHTVLWGNDLDACHNALELSRLAREHEGTRLTWLLPKRIGKPKSRLSLPENSSFARDLEQDIQILLDTPNPQVVVMDGWGIESVHQQEPAGWHLRIQIREDETLDLDCDEIINCARTLPDWRFALSLALPPRTKSDERSLLEVCLTDEPHYYVLGQKTCPQDLLSIPTGHEQIRSVFSLIGGRENLDLYATIRSQDAQ